VVVEPAQQGAVAVGELGLHAQDGIIHGVPQGERPADVQGLSAHMGMRSIGGLTCAVSWRRGSVRWSG
jgi:hypothetical protein